nr:hypothetical protein REIP_p065 [Rickettsia endosymbiont of Ixodes pacificus]
MTQKNKLTYSKEAFKKYNVLDTTHQYLSSDYFLPSRRSESYYSNKYGRTQNSISRIISTSLLAAVMIRC